MSAIVTIQDPLPGRRIKEPVTFSVPGRHAAALRSAWTELGEQVLIQRLNSLSDDLQTTYLAVVTFEDRVTLTLGDPIEGTEEGISLRTPTESDSYVRLNTGYFDLELCSGTAEGEGSSKWGLRHFSSIADGIDLLPSGNNAIGGFYGPFFTPENGLINPPEHTKVDIEVVEQGPLVHKYRMSGTVPDGLLPELRGKSFTIDWTFTYGTPYFQRRYLVDDFQTVINGRSITNKITVGDEFEGGRGELVFDRFATYGGTRYRSGDPYANELVKMVEETLTTSEASSIKFAEFKKQLSVDLESAHWDLYWRLFCTWEGALEDSEITERLAKVRANSHVEADLTSREWQLASEPVEVSPTPHATIFPGPADKSAHLHTPSGRAMVWWTSQPSGAFQIVQRKQSGWVNWGTNGENECPELPVGVQIKSAYGEFAEAWERVADQLETPPNVSVAG